MAQPTGAAIPLTIIQDKNADFAIKIFKDRPLRTGADFKKELEFLDELRKFPNDNIVTHLATWTQDGRYYMLFAYAECNLRQYMRSMTLGKLNKGNVLWLLKQFLGLANALREIHNLSGGDAGAGTSANLLAPTQDPRKSGWHHDLKPENILYFKVLSAMGEGFQIADFGSGKVHTYRSGSVNTKSANGTQTYEPPEHTKEGATSRPYDVWSMGCIFLELLLWAVFGYAAVMNFSNNRDGRRFPDSPTDDGEDDAFWQMDEACNITLRESVQSCINHLRSELQRRRLVYFEKVLDLIIRMLDTERRTRILALDLWNTLESIDKQATIDMRRLKREALPAELEVDVEESSSSLPRLSINAPDSRTPEPASPAPSNRSDVHSYRPAALYTGGDLLTASPVATSSTRAQRRDSLTSNNTLSSRSRGLSDSSIQVQGASSPARTPDSAREEGGE